MPSKEGAARDKAPEERVREAERALRANPDQTSPKAELLRQRERAVLELLAAADKARDAGKWDEAVVLYQRVLGLEDNNQIARSKLAMIEAERRYARLVADAGEMFEQGNIEGARNKLHLVFLEEPSYAPARQLQARMYAGSDKGNKAPELRSPPNRPISLQFRDANLKMVFEGLSRTAGVNFVLDKDIKPDAKTTVFVNNVTLDAAITAILNTNQLEKKVLDETTVLIYPNTPQKINEYRELVIKSFYLSNADVKQTAALLKTTLKVKSLHLDERLSLLVLRDTPEVVRLAEKLVELQDVAEPEVMLDVEILEIKRSKLTEIGITYPTNLTAGALNAAGTGFTALTLDALKNLNSKGITVSPNPAINFQKTDGIVNLLANPRIRVKSREKAKIQIGDRVPIVTANVSTTAATVSDTVTYLDVGLKLEVEPVVSLDDHVSIKVALEVGTIGTQTTTKNGSVVFQIGTRNASTLLRLKDGETQVLAGLINDEDRHNASKVPGLGDIPLLGRLFSNHSDSNTKTEIVLAITPHVINNLRRPSAEIMELWSGTENSINDIAPGKRRGVLGAVSAAPTPAIVAAEVDSAEQVPPVPPAVAPNGVPAPTPEAAPVPLTAGD